jgi:hypothetical protein
VARLLVGPPRRCHSTETDTPRLFNPQDKDSSISPSPCGNLPGPIPPGLPGRALSYSVTRGKATAEGIIAGTRVFRAGARVRRELPSWIAPRPIAESRSAYPQPPPVEGRPHDAAEARLRSYPFPMPPGSLPSLKPGDYAGSQFLPEDPEPSRTSALVTGDASQCSPAYRSAHTSSTSLPSTSSLPATEADRRHHFYQSDLGDYASGPVRPLSTLPPPHTSPPSFAPQAPSYWQNIPGMGTADAVPYIFEPIPVGEESLNLVQVDESNGAETPDPDSLTAMWCLLDEETQAQGGVEGSTTATAGDLGTFWDVEGVQAEEYWPQFNGACVPLDGGMMQSLTTPGLPGSFENPVELSSSVAAQIAAGWESYTAQAAQEAAFPQMQPQLGAYQTVYNPTTVYLEVVYRPQPAQEPQDQPSSSRTGDEAQGPFLSTHLPLSPIEAGATASSGLSRPTASSSNSREQPLIASLPPSAHIMPIPPDISSSAYPPTPLSVDPSGLPTVAGGDGATAL